MQNDLSIEENIARSVDALYTALRERDFKEDAAWDVVHWATPAITEHYLKGC